MDNFDALLDEVQGLVTVNVSDSAENSRSTAQTISNSADYPRKNLPTPVKLTGLTSDIDDILQELSAVDTSVYSAALTPISTTPLSATSSCNVLSQSHPLIRKELFVSILSPSSALPISSFNSPGVKIKCARACIVGTGGQNRTESRTCMALRCTSCDFRCISFINMRWDASMTYLFLRNNMPDANKLAVKLSTRKGEHSICCQCQWLTVTNDGCLSLNEASSSPAARKTLETTLAAYGSILSADLPGKSSNLDEIDFAKWVCGGHI